MNTRRLRSSAFPQEEKPSLLEEERLIAQDPSHLNKILGIKEEEEEEQSVKNEPVDFDLQDNVKEEPLEADHSQCFSTTEHFLTDNVKEEPVWEEEEVEEKYSMSELVEPKTEQIEKTTDIPITDVKEEEPDDEYQDFAEMKPEPIWHNGNSSSQPSTSDAPTSSRQLDNVFKRPRNAYSSNQTKNQMSLYTLQPLIPLRKSAQGERNAQKVNPRLKMRDSGQPMTKKIKTFGEFKNIDVNDKCQCTVLSVFEGNQHPTIETVAGISLTYSLPMAVVFNRFEQLRNTNNVVCANADSCNRFKKQFGNDECKMTKESKVLLMEEFSRLGLYRMSFDLHRNQLIQIMKNTNIDILIIKEEFLKFKQKRLLSLSEYTFDADEEYFKENPHPTIQEMMDIADTAQTDYTHVFKKFEMFRSFGKVVCKPNDTCQRVRGYFNIHLVPRDVLHSGSRKIMHSEFAKLNTRTSNLSVGQVHLIREKIDVKHKVVQREYDSYLHMKLEIQTRNQIASIFEKNYHPTLEMLMELSESMHTSVENLFQRFERLRAIHNIACTPDDSCSSIKKKLQGKNNSIILPELSLMEKNRLTEEFAKLRVENRSYKLNANETQMIMGRTKISAEHIKNEFEIFKKRKMLPESTFGFADDREHFNRNQHPSVEQMIKISEESGTDYVTVFRRFDQIRHDEHVSCVPNDVCHRVRRYLNNRLPANEILTESTKKLLLAEFDKLDQDSGLTVGYIHLIREKIDLKQSIIQQEFNKYKPMANNRMKKDVLHDLRQRFEQNANPTVSEIAAIAMQYNLKYVQVSKWFTRARSIIATQRAENKFYQGTV